MFKVMFLVSTGGIYFAYIIMSLVSQRLYSSQYPSIVNPDKKDKFTYTLLNVWIGCLFCFIFGKLRQISTSNKPNPIPLKQQIILGILYTINIVFANQALLYLSYHVQVLGRNCRLLLVIVVGIFFSRVHGHHDNKLGMNKLVVGIMITAGVIMFSFFKDVILNLTQSKGGSSQFDKEWPGYVCLFLSISADALFSDSQAYAKSNFKPTANHLFTSANFYTFLFCMIYTIVNGKLIQQITFCIEHPSVIIDLAVINILQVLGQVSIYYVVANYKQHVFPIISTTRKVITFVLSIFVYHHTVNQNQWISIILIFGGVIYEFIDERQANKVKKLTKSNSESSEGQSITQEDKSTEKRQ